MAEDTSSFETAALTELAYALAPLARLDSKRRVQNFIRELGWELPAPALDLPLAEAARLPALALSLTSAASPMQTVDAVAELFLAVQKIFETIDGLEDDVETAFVGSQNFLDNSGILDDYELPRRLTDYVIITYLSARRPVAHSILLLLGLIEYDERPADAAKFQPPFVLKRMRWERFPELFDKPDSVIADAYDWGKPEFKSNLFIERLGLVLRTFRVPGGLYQRDPDFKAALDPDAPSTDKELRIPLYSGGTFPDTYSQLGLSLARAAAANPGLALQPYLVGAAATTFPLSEKWELELSGGMTFEGGVALVLLPGSGLKIRTNLLPTSVSAAADLADGEVALTLRPTAAGETVLFGQPGRSRFAADNVEVRGVARVVNGDGELLAQLELSGAKIIISGGDFDGFLSKVLPKEAFTIDFDFGLLWSSKSGFHIEGGAGFEKTFAIHLSLFDVIHVDSVDLAVLLNPAAGAIEGSVATTVDIKLGPLVATVQKIGLEASLEVRSGGGGNLGVINAQVGFKPPVGAAIAIDSNVVSGGGYLLFDREQAQYAGVLSVAFQELDLTALALLTTRMPDGAAGFSLIAIIAMEFDPPYALGYGFFLKGVGGLIGVNRTMKLDAIQAGIRTGAIDSILFPENPIANVTRIISDLRAIFPPQEGRFVFGPMVIITWGVPTIISGQIAILIELPPPIRLAILGQLLSILPESDENVIQLRLDVAGLVDFSKKTLSVDASLFDSHLVVYPLDGEMALRSSWGNDAFFALAVGGGHPAYKFPPRFPTLRRVNVSIGKSDNNPRLRLETYFALTENTVQFGARAELEASMSKFDARGDLAFDTLIYFSPFSFIAEVRARIDVRLGGRSFCGASLDFKLEGPTPWHARGKAKFKVAFVSYDVGFNKTFGRSSDKRLPPLDPWMPLRAALAEPGNWITVLPGEKNAPVVIRDAAATAGSANVPPPLIIDPVGHLVVRQKVVPLGVQITRFGKGRPPVPVTFDLSASVLGLSATAESGEFPPGDFWDRSKSDLLSVRYESHKCGVRIRGADIDYIDPVVIDVVYEEDYEPTLPNTTPTEVTIPRTIGLAGARLTAGRRGEQLSTLFGGIEQPASAKRVGISERSYVITDTSDLTSSHAPTGAAAAWARLNEHLMQHPEDRGKLQIVQVEKKAVA